MRGPDQWTVRTRLVVAAVALTGVALVLANAAGLGLLRDYLVDRLDEQLRTTTQMASMTQPLPFPLPEGRGVTVLPFEKKVVARIVGDRQIFLFTSQGRLAGEFPSAPGNRPDLGPYDQMRKGEPYTVPGTDGPSWRVMAVDLPDGGAVVMTASLAEVEAIQRWLLAIDGGVMAGVLLLLGLAAAALVRLGLRPLTRIEETAGHIAAGDFSRRVPDADPHTEPGRLGIAMNVMLDRVEREIAARAESEARMRRFLADASHELRTPLTSVRGFAELYRRGGTPPGPPMDETMRRIEEEATRMGVLVNDLLALADLDEERPMEARPADLLEIAADTIRDARARVPDRQVRLAGLGSSLSPVLVLGDEARLRQVAANLVANALAHTPQDAKITVRVGTGTADTFPTAAVGSGRPEPMGVFEVRDTGPGIPAEHAPRVFERLYRVSESRSRAAGGAGLGLAIVAAIVKAHGGRVELRTAPGSGAAFRVLLPLRASPHEITPRPDSEGAPR
ncbi:HAMP domain-containing histidine kinase [Planotetraspora sp. A-T 1434]|uniref:sensor histidine kinase n=1 Tax=Planotetraspora sp. A-T 1434 TaxID=2979219 RepID=UPI0021C11C10|nr:HAMP domain-containing histidine kinase [Planotetraspora sp. A-T 1434]MCT9934645.1 HAMP domain-containing histidine kinase [Planotetraspora sp. A-T 1434]